MFKSFRRQVFEMGVAAADAGVAEQYVQVPKFFHSCVYHTGAILCTLHVRLDSERLPPHCLDLFGNLTGSLPFDNSFMLREVCARQAIFDMTSNRGTR